MSKPTFSSRDRKAVEDLLGLREPHTVWRVWVHYLRTRYKPSTRSIGWFLEHFETHERAALAGARP
jgi:hypothetical protein